jgi:hypothetical protein
MIRSLGIGRLSISSKWKRHFPLKRYIPIPIYIELANKQFDEESIVISTTDQGEGIIAVLRRKA